MTSRLVLEPIVPDHADEMFDGLLDATLYAYTGGAPPGSVDTLRTTYAIWARRASPDGDQVWLNWLVRCDGRAAGYVQATVEGEEAWIAYVIFRPFQRGGIAREATEAMIEHLLACGVREIAARIDVENEASLALARSLGLERREIIPSTDGSDAGDAIFRRALA